jgi:FkbM family methyltransferase
MFDGKNGTYSCEQVPIADGCGVRGKDHSILSFLSIGNSHPAPFPLQTGARYGTTSCVIANKQENSGKLVSVEPDYRVWNLLDENAKAHNCHFWLLRGAVSDRPVTIDGTFYSTRSIAAPSKTHRARGWHGQDRCNDLDAHSRIPLEPPKSSYTYEELQAVTKLRFTALLIDCEGCIESLFAGNSVSLDKLLQDVNTIILEADMPVGALDCTHDCVDYAVWIAKFAAMGLAMVETVQDPVYPKIFHYVFQRKVGSA